MLLKRFYHDGLAQASYLIGCQKRNEAVVIDATRDIDTYIAAAAAEKVRITHVTETHIHADYLSGSRELARATGAQLLLSGEGGEDWQYAFAKGDGAQLLRDGDSFMVGNIRVDVVHTPGHTPEHIVFVITDTPSSPRPVGACTGDFIFVGDVGRPDLLERAAKIEGTMRAGASLLFQSIQRFVAAYPDYLQIWPGHGSGSACGKSLGAVPQSTLGYERVSNWALQLTDEATFIEAVLEGQPDPPVYFATMKRLNRAGPDIIGTPRELPQLASDALEGAMRDGTVIDVRRAADVALGGVVGVLNIPFKTSFVQWAGWLVPYDRPIYFIVPGESADVAAKAASELRMIGLDGVEGWFAESAVDAWRAKGHALSTIAQATPEEVEASLLSKGGATLIDVRGDSEWEVGHIEGARHIPLGHLGEQANAIAKEGPVYLQCQGGGRSSIAASVLLARGFRDVRNVAGGIDRWEESGRPTTRDAVETGA